jgi:hypothetical protein
MALKVPITSWGYFGAIFKAAHELEAFWSVLPNERYVGPIVVTDKHVYDQSSLHVFLERVGIPHAKPALTYTRKPLAAHNFTFPGVKTTVVYSLGLKTIATFKYGHDWEVGKLVPLPSFGDGDGQVPLQSLSYTYDIWKADPKAASMVDRIVYQDGPSHIPIVMHQPFVDSLKSFVCHDDD